MGDLFEIPRRTYVLQFEGDGFDGLEVKMRPATVREALDNLDLQWYFNPGSVPHEEYRAKQLALYELFVSRLVGWNLAVDGEVLPTTVDSLLDLPDAYYVGRIIRSWLIETSQVPAPLSNGSGGGETSPEPSEDLSLSMEVLEGRSSLAS